MNAPESKDLMVEVEKVESPLAVAVSGLRIGYPNSTKPLVIKDLNLTLDRGAFLSIVGPSGCGKTTLAMAVAGLLTPEGGQIHTEGELVTRPQPRTTSLIFQDSNLLNWRTVRKNVELPMEILKFPKKERGEASRRILEIVGLSEVMDRRPSELSGGMRHRVALARGLATSPKLLIMDEPFAALDEQTRNKMGQELLTIWEALRPTVLFITHSLSEALFLSDRVIAMGSGSIKDDFPIDFPRPRSLSLMNSAEFVALRRRLFDTLEQS